MFERTEAQYVELQKKKQITIDNRKNFEDSIAKLDELKNSELEKTSKFVTFHC